MAVRTGSGILGRFFGRTVSEAAAFGAGIAIGPVLGPPVQELRNVINAAYPVAPPDAVLLAEGVAHGQIDASTGRTWASYHGFGDTQFDAMVAVFDGGPGLAFAFELWRRGLIAEGGFRRAAQREGIEQEWIDALVGLRRRLLSPAELANAVVQGFRTQADAAADAALHGVNAEDFGTMVDVTGLPPGPETLQEWTRRGIIDEGELAQGIREGHTKTKYVDEYVASLTRVLSATEYAGLWLRGWISEQAAKAGGRLTGYDADAMDLLYRNRGRPATVRQAHIGFARGGRLPEAGDDEEATLRRAVEQSNIRTEWFDLLYAQRFTYPSAFVVRALAQDGTFPQALTETILVESGWRPEWAQLAAEKWAGGGDAPAAKWANRARTRLFTVAHNEYLDESISEDQARQVLGQVGAGDAEQDAIVAVWNSERDINRLELTPAQIKKAYKAGRYDLATALAELGERGLTAEDADTLLQS